ncbi:MAG: hypothetical protein PHW13_08715 [Methylococcales bacterium]|nr:hypothetical protein [Methylococcales bacterium]
MQFTKSLIAATLLAAAGAAQAGTFAYTDEVLTIVDTTNDSAYNLDLGVTPTALISSPSLNVSIDSTDANFAAFMNGVTAGDNVIYRLEGTYVSGKNGTLLNTFTTSSSSDISAEWGPTATAGLGNTIGNSTGGVTGTLASYAVQAGAGSMSAYWAATTYATGLGTNNSGGEGPLVNSAALGSGLTLWDVSKTSSAVSVANTAAVDFTVSGTGSSAVGTLTVGAVSAVPLPTSVWLFLSGVMGVLSLKRRKHSAV